MLRHQVLLCQGNPLGVSARGAEKWLHSWNKSAVDNIQITAFPYNHTWKPTFWNVWNDIHAVADLPDPGQSYRQFRYVAYRQFVVWQYGALGQGHRVVIPSCCVWKIRNHYPDPLQQYRGFIPSRV